MFPCTCWCLFPCVQHPKHSRRDKWIQFNLMRLCGIKDFQQVFNLTQRYERIREREREADSCCRFIWPLFIWAGIIVISSIGSVCLCLEGWLSHSHIALKPERQSTEHFNLVIFRTVVPHWIRCLDILLFFYLFKRIFTSSNNMLPHNATWLSQHRLPQCNPQNIFNLYINPHASLPSRPATCHHLLIVSFKT